MMTLTRTLSREKLAASWRAWISNDDGPDSKPAWLQWFWTLAFCVGMALMFTLATLSLSGGRGFSRPEIWPRWFAANFVVSLAIGVLAHALFDLTRWLFIRPGALRAWSPWKRGAYVGGVLFVAVVVGWPLGMMLADQPVQEWVGQGSAERLAVAAITIALVSAFVMQQVFGAKAARIEAERAAAEAQLKLLQAQIEPHFLFNTLANVQGLIAADPPRAAAMLQAFTDYLRGSFADLRRDEVPLATELALAEAYLRVQQARMEDRLAWTIDADEGARAVPVPPLVLQPLVENAVVHGVEPRIDGGRVVVTARLEGRSLVVEVRDVAGGAVPARDDRGEEAGSVTARERNGHGVALANVRQRLAGRHGDAARLEGPVPAGDPLLPGMLARLTLPAPATAAQKTPS